MSRIALGETSSLLSNQCLMPSSRIAKYLSTLCCPSPSPSRLNSSGFTPKKAVQIDEQSVTSTRQSDVDLLIAKIRIGSSDDEIYMSLLNDQACQTVEVSHNLVDKLLCRFKDDWKSALGVFRWAKAHPDYKPLPELYDMVVDILGKMKQMEKMKALVEEMREGNNLITLSTISKLMRRLTGAGEWEFAVKTFDDLGNFGLKKNTESMNLLLDTLCKENKVEQARSIFLELKSHIPPNANTFNILIHGWCKVNLVDEAHWTIQEMKGYGFSPCVISYSTIIQSYCIQSNFLKVYELLDDMRTQGCQANIVTYTTIMCSLTKKERFEEAIDIAERMKVVGCKPDAIFYNALIHAMGRAGQVKEAIHVFQVEMRKFGVKPNTSTYSTLIAMLCHRARECEAFNLLKELEISPFCDPDVQSYYPLLKMCFKTGKIDGCLSELLDDMVKKHHLSLDLSTYTLLIHGFCRANKSERAYLLFQEMIGKEITPRYRTLRLLLDEMKQKNMDVAAERMEEFMNRSKTS